MASTSYTKTGTKATTSPKLDKTVFGVTPKNHELLKAAYLSYLANGRMNLAVTKTRGEVRGGGKKPWRQKGTGRARFGSTRNPIWRHGGVAFGPTGEENYTKTLPLKAKRQAIRQALSVAESDGRIKVVESFVHMDKKTQDMVKFLAKIEATGNVLCVVGAKDNAKERATWNIPSLKVCSAKYLTVFDLMNADAIVMSNEALGLVHEWLGSKASS